MEVQVSKENIGISKLVAEKKEIVFIEHDMIVPDTKPDILNTINTSGNICIYKKEVLDEKVKIDGNINTYIMYLPDSKEDSLRALNCQLDFSESISVPGAREGTILTTKSMIRDIECKVINGRKITIRAGVEFEIKIYSNEEVAIMNQVNNIEDIQILQESFNISSLIGNGKTSVYAKETFNIEPKDELAEVLKVDIKLVDKDIKISYNKVLAKAELDTRIMYLTEDNRIGRTVGRIPVVGFIDIPNIAENNICDINYEVKNMIIRPNPAEEHSIYIELEIEETCMAYERKQINMIQDLYSPTCHLQYSQKRISSCSDKNERTKEISIQERVQISGAEEGNLLDVEVVPNLMNTNITTSKITYSGEFNLNFIFSKENSLQARNAKVPFEFSVDNAEGAENINVENEIAVGNTNFEIASDGVANCEIAMEVSTKTSRNINMNLIDNIEVVEEQNQVDDEDYDSLILYIVQPGDTLWKIAKRFNSTVEELTRMNGIEDESMLSIGQKIYIPKFNQVKRENKDNAREPSFV